MASSVQGLNMCFTTHSRVAPLSAPAPVPSRARARAPRVDPAPMPSYIYRSPTAPVSAPASTQKSAISAKQSLASMFKNIQAKKSCRSCGGFK